MILEPREALDAIGLLPDAEIDIAGAALQFARIDAPSADWEASRRHLSDLAREAVERGRDLDEADLLGRTRALCAILADRYGYFGDAQTYDDPANANLIRVTQRRRGLPVALGIVWLHCARALDWAANGVDFPGHFLLALQGRGTQVVLDVFSGGAVMEARDLRALIKRIEGDGGELRPGLLQPMSARAVLVRLQNNIKLRRLEAGNLAGALVCVEDTLRAAPDVAPLWREAALMSQRLGLIAAALRCYERFVALVPEGEAARRALAAIDDLRARLN